MNEDLKLNAMLICGKKCGSTWLERLCSNHSDIFITSKIQINTSYPPVIKYIDWGNYSNEKVRLARVNLKHMGSFERAFFKHNSEIIFICLLRDPIKRTYSDYKHTVRKGRILGHPGIIPHHSKLMKVIYDFNIAVNEEFNKEGKLPGWLQKSQYYKCLEPYFKMFSKDKFLIMSLERASSDPKALFDRISDFLNIRKESPLEAEKKINVDGYPYQGFLKKRLETIPPTDETKRILEEFVLSDARKLDKEMNLSLMHDWGYD